MVKDTYLPITPVLSSTTISSMSDFQVSVVGVTKILKELKTSKASGPDGISARFLNEVSDEIAPAMALLFNASLQQSAIPTEWKQAIINPIYKAGKMDRGKAENYRPISLTSVTCKLMEHIICTNINKHLENNGVLSNAQHGFRKKRNCETQLIAAINDFARALNDGMQIDTILLDFSKAFDKVDHRKLCLKLENYGIRGNLLNWIKDFLNNRKQWVVINGERSSVAKVKSGVPQGTVLGPLLFLIYINDLPEGVKSTLRLFADDSFLYRIITSSDDTIQLQTDLNALIKWEKEWSMEFHPDKCKLLRITKKINPIQTDYHMHGYKLESVDEAKYLGVLLQEKLSWKPHVNKTSKKANQTRAFLQRNIHGCCKAIKNKCYNI